MTTSLRDGPPDALREVRTRPLFVMRLDVRPLQIIGATLGGYRRVGCVPSGVFDGERLSGRVLEGAPTGRASAVTEAPHSMCGWCSRRSTTR